MAHISEGTFSYVAVHTILMFRVYYTTKQQTIDVDVGMMWPLSREFTFIRMCRKVKVTTMRRDMTYKLTHRIHTKENKLTPHAMLHFKIRHKLFNDKYTLCLSGQSLSQVISQAKVFVITQRFGTPYLLTTLILKFEIVDPTPVDVSKILQYV